MAFIAISLDILIKVLQKRFLSFLAHLSQRLTRWAYSIPMVLRPSSSSTLSDFNISEASWPILIKFYVTSLGWGKGCIRFWSRLDQNSGYHANRKPPLAYTGENDVATFSRLLLIRFILVGNEDTHKRSNKFEFRPDQTLDYGVSCLWASKKFPIDL